MKRKLIYSFVILSLFYINFFHQLGQQSPGTYNFLFANDIDDALDVMTIIKMIIEMPMILRLGKLSLE